MEFDNSLVRRQDRLLNQSCAMELLRDGEYGFLALQGCESHDGGYGIPINYVLDLDGATLWFHCAPEGEKLKRIMCSHKVSFCVVGKTQIQPDKFSTLYESVMAFGHIEVVEDDDIKRSALALLVAKYSPDYIEKGTIYADKSLNRTVILRLRIERISAKAKSFALLPSL